jgi:hypothetical protein
MTMASPTTKGNTSRQGPGLEGPARVAALVDVLDEDIRHVEATLVQLDTLRGLLIKRDDRALETLLEEIHMRGEAYAATEYRRQELRRELAAELGRSEKDLTLSELLAQLTGPDRTALAERQKRLKVLIGQLKREHTLTSLLISDCAKFNRSLLHVFFGPAGKTGTMYSSTGAAQHPIGTALLNMRL